MSRKSYKKKHESERFSKWWEEASKHVGTALWTFISLVQTLRTEIPLGIISWYLVGNLPPCKQLEERLHLCTELLHFEFCGEAMPIPVRSKNNFDKHIIVDAVKVLFNFKNTTYIFKISISSQDCTRTLNYWKPDVSYSNLSKRRLRYS